MRWKSHAQQFSAPYSASKISVAEEKGFHAKTQSTAKNAKKTKSVFESVDYPHDAILDHCHVEINLQAQSFVG
jgi:hypothetical protein